MFAQGHGPVFGYATPTNSQGEYSFDVGLLTRSSADGTQLAARGIVTYGFTSFLQIAVTTPALLTDTLLPPTRMTGGDDFEAKLGWRFHHHIKGVGTRFESTLFTGLVVPGPQSIGNLPTSVRSAPGGLIAFTTGHCFSQLIIFGPAQASLLLRHAPATRIQTSSHTVSSTPIVLAMAHRTKQMGLARSRGNDGRTVREFRRVDLTSSVVRHQIFLEIFHPRCLQTI